jgi:hypothetical protein
MGFTTPISPFVFSFAINLSQIHVGSSGWDVYCEQILEIIHIVEIAFEIPKTFIIFHMINFARAQYLNLSFSRVKKNS